MIVLGITFTESGVTEHSHISPVSARSKFQAGDRVRLHGYSGCPKGWERWGMRGFVLGAYGGDLRGLTDEGLEWVASASALTRDGERPDASLHCVCCPRPPRRRRSGSAPKELKAFGPAPECLRPYLPAAPVGSVQLGLFEVAA